MNGFSGAAGVCGCDCDCDCDCGCVDGGDAAGFSLGADGSVGFGPVGASFLRKSRREGSSWSCPFALLSLLHIQPMFESA